MYRLLIILTLLACGPKNEPKAPAVALPALEAQALFYLDQIPQGWIFEDECDSLLFSGLLGAARLKATGVPLAITEARESSGQWHRRPAQDCGPQFGNSRSIISRDQLIGLFFYLWTSKDLKSAKELLSYLRVHSYLLGKVPEEGTVGELFVSPHFLRTLVEMIAKLEGKACNETECFYPLSFSAFAQGFERHIQVWHIVLRGLINGGISQEEFDILKKHKQDQPHNPLYSAAFHKYEDGNFEEAQSLLRNYPSDRLPTNAEHCSDWPIQRDLGKDWEPCSEVKQHLGAELPTIYYLIIHPS